MAQPIPFSRNTGAARARHAKAQLLPMPRQIADDLALRVHLALDTLSRDAGSMTDAQTLLQTILLTRFLAEAGFGFPNGEHSHAAERMVSAIFDMGRRTGKWIVDDPEFGSLAAIVSGYDQLLHRAPLWALTEASERLERFMAGLPYHATMKKRA
jgi:hypothetical protein